MADEVLFEFLHSELVSYALASSEKDKTVIDKRHMFFCCCLVLDFVQGTDCAQTILTDYWSSVLAWWFVHFRIYRIFNWLQDNWKVNSTYRPVIVVDMNKPPTMAQQIAIVSAFSIFCFIIAVSSLLKVNFGTLWATSALSFRLYRNHKANSRAMSSGRDKTNHNHLKLFP